MRTFIALLLVAACVAPDPDKCCVPLQWEADVFSSNANYFIPKDAYSQVKVGMLIHTQWPWQFRWREYESCRMTEATTLMTRLVFLDDNISRHLYHPQRYALTSKYPYFLLLFVAYLLVQSLFSTRTHDTPMNDVLLRYVYQLLLFV